MSKNIPSKNINSQETQPTMSGEDLKNLYKKRVGEFVGDITGENPNFFDIFTGNIEKKFEEYLSKKGVLVEFDERFLSQEYCKNILYKSIAKYSFLRKTYQNSFKKNLLRSFDLESPELGQLDIHFQALSNPEQKEILFSGSRLQEFVKKIIKKDVKNQERSDHMLQSIFGNIDEKYRNDTDFMASLAKLYHMHNVHTRDMHHILQKIQDDDIEEFVKYFISNITLKEYLEITHKDIKDSDIQNIITQFVSSSKNSLDKSDIETQDILLSFDDKNIDWKNIAQHIKSPKSILSQKITQELNGFEKSLEDEIVDFSDFLAKIEDKNLQNMISKMEKGGYIVFETGNTQGKTKHYFAIDDITKDGFELRNITLGNNKVSSSTKQAKEKSDFDDFLKYINNLRKDRSKGNIEVFSKQVFEEKMKKNEIISLPERDEIQNKQDFLKMLDDIDPEGAKITPKESFTLCCEEEKKDNQKGGILQQKTLTKSDVYTITHIDDNFVYISGQSPLSLGDFIQAFQERKNSKRLPYMKNSYDFYQNLSTQNHYSQSLKDFEFKDGKIIKKGDAKKQSIEYFVGEDGECVRVKKLGENNISFEEGVFKEGKGGKNSTFEKKYYANNIDYNRFFVYMKEKKLSPYTKNIQEKQNEEESKNFKRKRSFLGAYMGFLSIAEIITGGKQIIDSIEQSLQTGNKLKSAQFALKLGKFLPKSVQEDLQSMVEGEEKKTMEELLSKLTTLDSKVMIPKIERIILSKSSQQYEIEAALFAMLSKYGTLYNKQQLLKYRGSFIWYEALGGRKGDNFYNKIKKECEEATLESGEGNKLQPKPFTEELLIEKLLGLQADGKMPPKRRSKIHKEMGSHLNKGISDELEDGANKAGDMVTLGGRMEYSIGELKNGGYANGLGALEKVFGKGGSAQEMHAIPFAITISGISKNFPERLLGKLLAGYGWGGAYTELMFNKDPASGEKFKKGMYAIIESLGDKGTLGEFGKIGSDVEKAYKFWMKYGGKIVDRMTGKDGYLLTNPDNNPDIANYYSFICGMQNDREYNIKPDAIHDGVFDYEGTPVVYTMGRKIASEYISFNQAGRINGKTGAIVFDTFLRHLDEIPNSSLDDESKFKMFFEIYSTLEPVVRAGFGGWEGGDVMRKSPEVKRLKSYGIDLVDNPYISNSQYQKDTTFYYTNEPGYELHVRQAYENFKNISFEEIQEDIEEISQYTKQSIDDILGNIEGRDNEKEE